MIRRIFRSGKRRLTDYITNARIDNLIRKLESNIEQNRYSEAKDNFNKILAININYIPAYHIMANVLMPGDTYLALLAKFHEYLHPKTYVEIGVSTGESIVLANSYTTSIGIDPMPRINRKIETPVRLYPVPSDYFFDNYNLMNELGSTELSFAYIDGLHHYDQVLRDFINLEKYSNKNTVIIVHDCLPITRSMANRNPVVDLWCGDVWKAINCLIQYRPDLTIGIIPTQPSGLAIITNLDPTSTTLLNKYEEITQAYNNIELNYDCLDFESNTLSKKIPNLIPNNWQQIENFLKNNYVSSK